MQNGEEYFAVKSADFVEVQDSIRSFKKTSHASAKTVRGLLTVMRYDIEKAHDIGVYDAQDCIQEALSIYTTKELARISVAHDTNLHFKASKMFIVEVIRNIITNAFKYAGRDAQIKIWCNDKTLHIRDNGVGIDSAKVSKIFEHSQNSNGQMNGTGLGLAFCKRVMDAFGFSIECQSTANEFTEFVLCFK